MTCSYPTISADNRSTYRYPKTDQPDTQTTIRTSYDKQATISGTAQSSPFHDSPERTRYTGGSFGGLGNFGLRASLAHAALGRTHEDEARPQGDRATFGTANAIDNEDTEDPPRPPAALNALAASTEVHLHVPIELYTRNPTQDARRWLGRFDREVQRQGLNTPSGWLTEFNCMLDGEAATWADTDARLSRILVEDSIARATRVTVQEVRTAFLERWKRTVPDRSNPIPNIQGLKQSDHETLRQYYLRALGLLRTAGGEDTNDPQSPAAASLLELTVDRFLSGIKDNNLRLRVMQFSGITTASRTLEAALSQAEVGRNQLLAEERMREEIRKDQELMILRQMATAVL